MNADADGADAGHCDQAERDCLGVCGGAAARDDCGVCNGHNASKDCQGICGGSSVVDCLGECGGAAQTDCSGVCQGADRGIAYYPDTDQDGLGAPDSPPTYACPDQPAPAGRTSNANDCNDQVYGCQTDCSACGVALELHLKAKLTSANSLLAALVLGEVDDAGSPSRGVAGVGDINGDSTPDLMFGSSIIYLGPSGSALGLRSLSAVELGSSDGSSSFGAAVAGLGDIDGNGVPDLAIGEPGYVDLNQNRGLGRVWIVRLAEQGAVVLSATATTFTPSSSGPCLLSSSYGQGARLAAADLDVDGQTELIVSSLYDCRDGVRDKGRLDFWKLLADGSHMAHGPSIEGLSAPYSEHQFLRAALATPGDVDGNQAPDLVVALQGPASALWSFLFQPDSPAGMAATATRTMGASLAQGREYSAGILALPAAGASPAKLVAAYEPNSDGEPTLIGFALDAHGAAKPESARLVRLIDFKPRANAGFGKTMANLGDLDGDGLGEIVVSAPGDDEAGAASGALYILGFGADCGPNSSVGDCDGSLQNGCETQLDVAEHCGGCGVSCLDRPQALAGACVEQEGSFGCELTCEEGFEDCNDDPRDGCELSVAGYPNTHDVECNDGALQLVCETGFGDCDGDTENGCETSTLSDLSHCGSCAACPDSVGVGMRPTCVNGACVPTSESSGYCAFTHQDSNTDPSDGCDLCGTMYQVQGMGPAVQACAEGEVCKRGYYVANGFTPIAVCEPAPCGPPGVLDCDGDGQCDDDVTSEFRCGACNSGCGLWTFREYCVLNAAGDGYECVN